MLTNKDLCKLGIVYIADVLDDNGNVLTCAQIAHKYLCEVSWMEYVTVLSVIPQFKKREMKTYVLEHVVEPRDTLYACIVKKDSKCAYIHQICIETSDVSIAKRYSSFSKDLNVTFDEYIESFMRIRKNTHISKYRDFMYHLLMNSIFTNNRLYHWKKVPSKMCEMCSKEMVQTLLHLFVECDTVQRIWIQFQEFIEKCTNIEISAISLMKENLMLSRVHKKPTHLVNLLITIVKQHMYYCKCSGNKILFRDIINKIENTFQMERYNASVTGIKTHINEWKDYKTGKK